MATATTTINVALPKPFRAQLSIISSPARFRAAACGRRFGKTHVAAGEAVIEAANKKVVWWVAPTFEVTRRGWRVMMSIVHGVPGVDVQKGVREIHFPGGGFIGFKTADTGAGLLGEGLDFLVIDEASVVPEQAWLQDLRPSLTDRLGRALFIGTPRGRNWFWREWLRGQDTAQTDWASWQFPTSANPNISPAEIELAREQLPERVFRQEYLAEFLDDAGAVFRGVTEAATAPASATPAEHQGHRIVIGADWGKSKDFTALSVLCATCRRQVALDRFNRIEYAFQAQRLRALAERWGGARHVEIQAETNAMGEPVIEQLRRMGLVVRPFTTTAQSKPPLIESLALALERGELAVLPDPVQTGELQAYTMALNRTTGRPTYSAPSGGHDDTVMALALAWHGSVSVGLLFA